MRVSQKDAKQKRLPLFLHCRGGTVQYDNRVLVLYSYVDTFSSFFSADAYRYPLDRAKRIHLASNTPAAHTASPAKLVHVHGRVAPRETQPTIAGASPPPKLPTHAHTHAPRYRTSRSPYPWTFPSRLSAPGSRSPLDTGIDTTGCVFS